MKQTVTRVRKHHVRFGKSTWASSFEEMDFFYFCFTKIKKYKLVKKDAAPKQDAGGDDQLFF